jgi:hypothetical protein
MDKTISGHLDAEWHRRVVVKSRVVHAMLFAGSKPPVGRAAVVLAATDMALKDQSIALISAQHLVCLVDLHSFKWSLDGPSAGVCDNACEVSVSSSPRI